jgi:predicted RNA-binding protein with PUA-like domain
MSAGDQVLVYHSVGDKEVVGIARVVREAYPDATADEDGWVAVDLAPVKALTSPVSLAAIKAESSLRGMALVRQGRLSVSPLSEAEFRTVVALGGSPGRKPAPPKATKKPPAGNVGAKKSGKRASKKKSGKRARAR